MQSRSNNRIDQSSWDYTQRKNEFAHNSRPPPHPPPPTPSQLTTPSSKAIFPKFRNIILF